MATTTNYGWTTPDDTDLVKDGAADIRTLGSSIDTTTKALNPSTTTGDIEYRSATANTNARLALGTAGQVLQVNSGATAPEWATPAVPGSFIHITTVTFSASSSIDLSDIFSSTYENYFIIGNWTGTADNDLNYRYRVSGSDNSTANYNRNFSDSGNNVQTGGRATAQTLGRLGATRASGSRISLSGYFIAPFLTQTKHSHQRLSVVTDTIVTSHLDIGFNDATSFTGLTVYPGAGTVTGTLSIFGIKNS